MANLLLSPLAQNAKKRGMFAEPDPVAKRYCTANPEYRIAFQRFDADGTNTIDIRELANALQAVKDSIESPTLRSMQWSPQNFHANTVLWLASRFAAGSGGVIQFPQFAEMMQYLQSVKEIFQQIDTDHTGDLSVSELSRALSLSGFNVTGIPGGGDPLSMMVAEKIGRAYDEDKNGVLTFDEFVQLRLEWDCYLDAWSSNVPMGSNSIAPQQLLGVLEAVKSSLEPVSVMAALPALAALDGWNIGTALAGLYYASMFKTQRPFHVRTVEVLIRKFGSTGNLLNFEQFCMMMEFIKEAKKSFTQADQLRNGKIDINELALAFSSQGLPMAIQDLVVLARRYDQDQSGFLEFDEFLQMMVELTSTT
mmetsp:Transcript_52924/g.123897  ORF Transcript_52924/g.123897 Transcript_52924/m.123897 type:complete len:365 (-) Transcript_52924:125-1219(-)